MEIQNKKSSVSWSSEEHEHLEKDLGWYLFIGFTALILVIFAFWKNDFFFGIFLIIATSLLMVFASRRPETYEFRVDRKGVTIGNKLFHYNELREFSVRMRAGSPREIVVTKNTSLNPFVHLPADRHTLHIARTILADHLPETEFKETFADIFTDFLGF